MLDRIGVLSLAAYPHRELMRTVQRAEELGFGAFWYADERFYHETYVGLTACALATSRIRLGPGVTDPYSRHPALTAMAVGSLDELSGGRAVLGFGAGAWASKTSASPTTAPSPRSAMRSPSFGSSGLAGR